MQVRRYEAGNMKDILFQIKRDMGRDAIVLGTKILPGRNGRIEVLAAKDELLSKDDTPAEKFFLKEEKFISKNKKGVALPEEIEGMKALLQSALRGGIEADLEEIKEGMDALLALLIPRNLEKNGNGLFQRIYYYLIGRGVSDKGALKILTELNKSCSGPMDFEQGLDAAEEIVKGKFSKDGKDNARVKIFVGPTGVGKTTTLAKLAARYALEQKRSVGLITMDTYRVAAATQLKTYARIMGLPLEVADEAKAFHRSMDRFRDKEFILIDTPGRGRKGSDYLFKLKKMLAGEERLEANLLLSLTASRENMLDVIGSFGEFGYDRVIFTKLDECSCVGVLYDIAEILDKPVSYLTTGQEVPCDIEKASPERLAGLILRFSQDRLPADFSKNGVR